MEPYQDFGMVGSLHLWGCLQCGALVTDKAFHNEWHDRIDRIAQEAGEWKPPPTYA